MSRIWVLTGGKAGDDGQAWAFASKLGGRAEEKRLFWSGLHVLPNWLARASLAGLDRRRSAELKPPWPDLVVGTGRRSVPVACWIRRQSRSRARIIFLGRPRAPLSWFDLVITTPQYGLPPEPNVAMAHLPCVAATKEPRDLGAWQERWSGLKRPLIGVLVGGSKYPYRLTRQALVNILNGARSAAPQGTMIVVTSPRTGNSAARILPGLVQPPHELHLWSKNGPNPYRTLLASADRLIVTDDSASMLAEALQTSRPVAVAFLPRWPLPSWKATGGIARLLARQGILTPPRDMRRVAIAAIAAGRADAATRGGTAGASALPCQDWEVIVARAKAILEQGRALSSGPGNKPIRA